MGDIGSRHGHIDMKCLPDISQCAMDFHDTSFFLKDPSRQLPTPASILERHPRLGSGIEKFEDMNMVVKFGPSDYLRLEEAQTMYAIMKAFPDSEVPVPEVFGWRTFKDYNFIYMSLIEGPTLRQAWPSLTESDKEAVSTELSRIIAALQRMTGNSPEALIGSVNGGTVQDRFFKLDYERGPFVSIRDFNDWIFIAATRQEPPYKTGVEVDGSYRDLLPDSGNVFFTHGDLTLGNIILSTTTDSPKRIAAIIDWEQAGWYPEYWEYCKLQYGVEYHHEWRKDGWADKIMKQFEDECFAFSEYSLWRCP